MADMHAADINDLPDSDFAYIEPGGTKDSEGKTTPRSLRHFPIHDAAHVRNALARLDQSPFGDKARPKVEAAAKRMGIGEPAGKAFEMKAAPMSSKQLDRWLAGEISRRILVVPFGGPIPSEKSVRGVDQDDEWFDEQTDVYGPFPGLRSTRRRVVDWHHDDRITPKPPVPMKGATFGEIVLDENPEEDGLWADWWTKVGEQNIRRIALLEKRGVALYGSSAAIPGTTVKASTGHIEVWPIYRHTITTAPINTLAVVPPLKGLLDDLDPDDLSGDAIKALLVGLGSLVPDLRVTLAQVGDDLTDASGEREAKAGRVLSAANEALLNAAIDSLTAVLSKLKTYAAADAAEDNAS